MSQENHKSTRPNFLNRGPGLLDAIYTAWCKATENLSGTQNNNTSPQQSPAAPYKIEPPLERNYS